MISTYDRLLLFFLILGLMCITHVHGTDSGNGYESSDSQWCDHFPDGTLEPGWTWIREDPDHWSLSDKPGYLQIIIQHGDLYGSWNHNENSLIRPAPARDFEVLTRFDMKPAVNYQQAGLVIYQDDDHYVRLTRAFADKNIVQMLREDGSGIISQEVECNQDSVYLLIRKQGTTYTGYWSADGNTWIDVNQYSDLVFSDLNIGIVAFTGPSTDEIPVYFDFVCIIPTEGVGTQEVTDTVSPVPPLTQSEFPVADDSDFDSWPVTSSDITRVSDSSSSCTIDEKGSVFIAIYAEGTVVRIDPDGEERVFVSGIDRPRFPVLDSAGNLYVGSFDGTIQQCAPDGTRKILASGIWSPQGMALDADENLYVAGAYDGKIYKITKSGTVTSIDSNLKNPRSLAVTKEGGIYYADTNGKEILFITPEGNYAGVADVGKNITGLALDNDTLYVSFEDTIAKVDPDGTLIPVIQNLDKPNLYAICNNMVCFTQPDGVYITRLSATVQPDETPVPQIPDSLEEPEFSSDMNKVSDSSSSCTIDEKGSVFIAIYAEGTVVRIDPDGEETVYVSGIDRPRFPVLDTSGNLYVGSFDGTIQQYAPDGTKKILASGIWSPQGMALDADENLYVAGAYDGKIYKITKSGTITSVDSNLKNPRSLAVTKEGGIYYADTNGKDILFITPEGNYAGVADVGKNITGLALDNDTLYVSFEDTIAKVDPDGTLIPVMQNLDKPNLYAEKDGIICFTQPDGAYLLRIRDRPESPSPSPTPEVTPTMTPGPEVISSSGYREATINHSGFDFSLGETGEYPTYDGEVIAWQPGGIIHPDFPRDSDYLWWRNEHLDQTSYSSQTKDMGEVDLASVKTVPAQWDTTPLIPPLLKGHTIVAKCADGYVKFQIISIDPADWSARVRYWYSPGKTFDDITG